MKYSYASFVEAQAQNVKHKFAELGLIISTNILKKWANLASFSFIFGLFKQTIQFLQQINVNNVHPAGAGIRTHNLLNMTRHP